MLPGLGEPELAIQASRWRGRFAIGDSQSQAIGSGVPSPVGHCLSKGSPKTTPASAGIDPHPPQHRDGAPLVDKKATGHPEALRIVNRDEHNTILAKLTLGDPLLPELRAEIGFALQRGRERIRRIR